MLNRLTKSAEVQTQVDDEYFKINMEGHQMRLRLEHTLKNSHQVRSPSGARAPGLVPLLLTVLCFHRSCRSWRSSGSRFWSAS